VIEELACRGYRVVRETARAFIEVELRQGRRLEEIKSDPAAFEGRILRAKLSIEAGLPAEETVFLDRAVPDSIAYYILEGLDPQQPRVDSSRVRYHRIFLFERLGFTKDPVRSENANTAAQIEELIEHAYGSLGYGLIRVPPMPIVQRADYVLNHIE
jgi:predicted ATPase